MTIDKKSYPRERRLDDGEQGGGRESGKAGSVEKRGVRTRRAEVDSRGSVANRERCGEGTAEDTARLYNGLGADVGCCVAVSSEERKSEIKASGLSTSRQ